MCFFLETSDYNVNSRRGRDKIIQHFLSTPSEIGRIFHIAD